MSRRLCPQEIVVHVVHGPQPPAGRRIMSGRAGGRTRCAAVDPRGQRILTAVRLFGIVAIHKPAD
jgi:hypothetical protein